MITAAVCPLCYGCIWHQDHTAALLWWELAHRISVDHVFSPARYDKSKLLEVLEHLGYVMSCDIDERPLYELCSIYDDFICIHEEHVSVVLENHIIELDEA